MIPALLCLPILLAVLWYAVKPRRRANDRPQTPVERLAQWDRRMGVYRAEERLRAHRAMIDFDARASVQPKFTPKLPKDNVVQLRRVAK